MASNSSFSEEDFSCPVCRDIFKDPVILSCSHSFCIGCVQKWWHQKITKQCPLCKKNSSTHEPPCNLALKNLCEGFTKGNSTPSESASKRRRTSSGFVTDAGLALKSEIRKSLKPLKEKLKVFNECKFKSEATAERINLQVQDTLFVIRDRFRILHQFLDKEEEAKITAVRAEEQQKCQMLKEKIAGLDRDIETLSNTISAIEEELKADHSSFLDNYETTKEKVRFTLEDPLDPQLLDVAKHTGNLAFRVWKKMMDLVHYHPVILDPCTVDIRLLLSDDLSILRYDPEIKMDRLIRPVLGSELISSGIHSWVVEVGDSSAWSIGVSEEFYSERGDNQYLSWRMSLTQDGKYSFNFFPNGPHRQHKFTQKPRKIRVMVDWSRGKLSFSDPDNHTHMHTFTHTFTNKLVPNIHTFDTLPLTILPSYINIYTEHDYDGRE